MTRGAQLGLSGTVVFAWDQLSYGRSSLVLLMSASQKNVPKYPKAAKHYKSLADSLRELANRSIKKMTLRPHKKRLYELFIRW